MADGVILEPLTNKGVYLTLDWPANQFPLITKKSQNAVCICREATITVGIGGYGLSGGKGGKETWKAICLGCQDRLVWPLWEHGKRRGREGANPEAIA
jgi:hypothetical protein